MPISGLVIGCRDERSSYLANSIAKPGEIEVQGVLPNGSIVAVIEYESLEDEVAIVKTIFQTDGVTSVKLAYTLQ